MIESRPIGEAVSFSFIYSQNTDEAVPEVELHIPIGTAEDYGDSSVMVSLPSNVIPASSDKSSNDLWFFSLAPSDNMETDIVVKYNVFVFRQFSVDAISMNGSIVYKAYEYDAKKHVDVDFLSFRSHNGNPAAVWMADRYNNTGKPKLQYSYDKENWSDYSLSTVLELSGADDVVYMKGYNERFASPTVTGHHKYFGMSGQVDAGGNVATLLRPNGKVTTMPSACFAYLFDNCRSLWSAPRFPDEMKNLERSAFENMFNSCTALTGAPAMDSIVEVASDWAMAAMFYYCSSLVKPASMKNLKRVYGANAMRAMYGQSTIQVPLELSGLEGPIPAYAFYAMFDNCQRLTGELASLPTGAIGAHSFEYAFRSTKLNQTSKKAPECPSMEIGEAGYKDMFYGVQTFEEPMDKLPATKLSTQSYCKMFSRCGYLKDTPVIEYTGTVPELAYAWMFEECNRLTGEVVISAAALSTKSLEGMFSNTGSRTNSTWKGVKVAFTDWNLAEYATGSGTNYSWFKFDFPNTSAQMFTCPAALDTDTITRGNFTIPTNWTIVKY